jgi:tetratricopeptide (TPR) repeat protein
LAVLAVEDDGERIERLAALYSSDQAPSPSTSARLEALLDDEEVEVIARAVRPRRSNSARKPEPEAVPEPKDAFLPVGNVAAASDEPPADEPPADDPQPEEGKGSEGPAEPVDKRDPARAEALAKQGLAAYGKGRFDEAEALFHRALGHNRRNSTALGGLAELYFERGSYQKATQFASKAVDAAPRSGKYRIVLGDAYFKTLAYQSARREYEKAKSLGHPSAAGRLAQLDKRLGQ